MQRRNLFSNQNPLRPQNLVSHKLGLDTANAAENTVTSRRTSQALRNAPVSNLFAKGVDVGVELALRWVEEELTYEPTNSSVQAALDRIRSLAQRVQQHPLQKTLLVSPVRTSRSRRRSAGRAQFTTVGRSL